MLDSLALLVIVFLVMSVVSVIGIISIYLVKSSAVRKGLLYFLAIWGMVISVCAVKSTPFYMTGEILISLGFGLLSVLAILIQLCMKREKKFQIARILVTVSVVAGMIDCFMI